QKDRPDAVILDRAALRSHTFRCFGNKKHPMDTGLTDRVVMVTGASGGIGQEVARAFRRERARVILHFRSHPERARGLAQETGPACAALSADLTDEAAAQRWLWIGRPWGPSKFWW